MRTPLLVLLITAVAAFAQDAKIDELVGRYMASRPDAAGTKRT